MTIMATQIVSATVGLEPSIEDQRQLASGLLDDQGKVAMKIIYTLQLADLLRKRV